jgi:DNA repair protein RadA/Sms
MMGKCTACNEWNTIVEEVIAADSKSKSISFVNTKNNPLRLSEINNEQFSRIDSHSLEFNRVLGGGIVPGSLILLGGEPGIGKSTLLLQTALNLKTKKILYISGEESAQQIKMRAKRIGVENEQCFFLNETSLESIIHHINTFEPEIVIIDSIQTLSTDTAESSPGSVTQVRECTSRIQRISKEKQLPVFLVGHINKDGNIAGPKVMEHIVDVVLQFEGDNSNYFRVLRTHKNRFGSTSEIGIFEMHDNGLKEVTNPSELLITQSDQAHAGTAISSTLEGLRPLLIEVQTLVGYSVYGTPQRSSTGFDGRRLNMLLAVLEKKAGLKLGSKDVFLNITGGIKVSDPAIDLAVIASLISSEKSTPIARDVCFAGEIALTGEIRPVGRIDQRINEAEKIGFSKIFISKYNIKSISAKKSNIEIIAVNRLGELFGKLF